MADRKERLLDIAVGDVFHATAPTGASLICLATEVSETTIFARTVTTQLNYEFERQTGVAECGDFSCTIDSVAPLPAEIHGALLGLDRKYGELKDETDLDKLAEKVKLSEGEIRALLFVSTHYPSNPI